jgi:hypothetical protein
MDRRSTSLAERDVWKNRLAALPITLLRQILIGEDDAAMVRRPIGP